MNETLIFILAEVFLLCIQILLQLFCGLVLLQHLFISIFVYYVSLTCFIVAPFLFEFIN